MLLGHDRIWRSARQNLNTGSERTERILISLGDKELARLAEEQDETEVCCHFCGSRYTFTKDEITALRSEAGRNE